MEGLRAGPYTRVLLVSPNGPTGLSFALNPIPLGLECIAACIKDTVEDVMIYDEFLDKGSFSNLLATFLPDLVGVSMSATEHDTGKRLIDKVKRFDARIPVIAGGFHPSGAPGVVFDTMQCDAVVRGEGEPVFLDIVQGKSWEGIAGLSYRKNGTIEHNPDREQVKDLDALPYPARDLRAKRGYVYKNNLAPERAYDLMYFGRGCWGKCTFCCEPYFSSGKQRYRTPERAFGEIMEIHAQHGKKPLRILISDPNILGQHKPVERLAELLIEAGNGAGRPIDITFQVMSRAEHVVSHPGVVEKMIRAGMISWELGLESSNEEDLVLTKKQIPLEKQERAVHILRSLGGEVLGTYVIGLESQTRAFIKTLPERGRAIGCASCAFGIATPFPGTGFWDDMHRKGRIIETNWARFDENNAVISHPELSPKELEDLRSWCMGRFWNLDVVVEQYRIQGIRVGPFRRHFKANLAEFFQSVAGKLLFAASAGGELASKHEGKAESQKDHYMKSMKSIFSAFINPRVEAYFTAHPMHHVVEMRQLGKMFKGHVFQVVLDNPTTRTCAFAMVVTVNEHGIDRIRLSRKPVLNHSILLRVDIDSMYVPSGLGPIALARYTAGLFTSGKIRLSGWRAIAKLVLLVAKEAFTARARHGSG